MTVYQHQNLAEGRWTQFNLCEQMANIGSEVGRALNWRKKNRLDYSQKAFERALELIDLTLKDVKNKKSLREITRVREALVDYFVFNNDDQTSGQEWQKYFYAFNFVAAQKRACH